MSAENKRNLNLVDEHGNLVPEPKTTWVRRFRSLIHEKANEARVIKASQDMGNGMHAQVTDISVPLQRRGFTLIDIPDSPGSIKEKSDALSKAATDFASEVTSQSDLRGILPAVQEASRAAMMEQREAVVGVVGQVLSSRDRQINEILEAARFGAFSSEDVETFGHKSLTKDYSKNGNIVSDKVNESAHFTHRESRQGIASGTQVRLPFNPVEITHEQTQPDVHRATGGGMTANEDTGVVDVDISDSRSARVTAVGVRPVAVASVTSVTGGGSKMTVKIDGAEFTMGSE